MVLDAAPSDIELLATDNVSLLDTLDVDSPVLGGACELEGFDLRPCVDPDGPPVVLEPPEPKRAARKARATAHEMAVRKISEAASSGDHINFQDKSEKARWAAQKRWDTKRAERAVAADRDSAMLHTLALVRPSAAPAESQVVALAHRDEVFDTSLDWIESNLNKAWLLSQESSHQPLSLPTLSR